MLRQFVCIFCALFLASLVIQTSPVFAQAFNQNDLNSLITNTPYYDPTDTTSTGTCSTSTTTSGDTTSSSTLTSGQDIYILGDSITERSSSTYVADFRQKGITAYVDASSGRSLGGGGTDGNQLSGMAAITADQAQIQKAQAVVIALGTNGGDTDSSVDQAISALNTKAAVYWVDTIAVGRTASPGEVAWDQEEVEPNNQAIYSQSAPEKYSVIPWYNTVDPSGNPQSPNGAETDANGYIDNSDGLGVHPSLAGIDALVNLVINSVTGNGFVVTPQSNSCCSVTALPTSSSDSNLDYAGRPMLNSTQLQTIAQNEPVYQQAAAKAGIPWQMLATIHLLESGLSLTNPTYNANGVYQILNTNYTEGQQLDNADFQAESDTAAMFIKSKVSYNYSSNRNLTEGTTDPDTIKDTFYSYNGRGYSAQAQQNGFNPDTQAFEGSPYVMNTADAQRDVTALPKNETTWGQYKTNGVFLYPADYFHGAYLIFEDISGDTTTACGPSGTSSLVAQEVVQYTKAEYALWQPPNPTMVPGTDFGKYTGGAVGPDDFWCDYPLQPNGAPVTVVTDFVPASVQQQNGYDPSGFFSIETGGKFTWHAVSSGYTPQPGDIVIHNYPGYNPLTHVNLVVGVSGSTITLIGGDEHGGGTVYTNIVNENVDSGPAGWQGDGIIGFVSPN